MAEVKQTYYGGVIDLRDANDPRSRIVNLTPAGTRVLEVGCGSGTIIAYLAREKGCRALAVEPDPLMAAEARKQGVKVVAGRVENEAVRQELQAKGPFDVIILADVLEHLVDPWSTLRQLASLLAPEGIVLASVPNVAHWTLRWQLLRGRWDYTGGFLMDQTHLRWFTKETLRDLFHESGYRIEELQVRWAPLPGDRLWRRLLPGRNNLYAALAGRWPALFGYQFVIRARR
jgi:methionine biosynthesis protein MetW